MNAPDLRDDVVNLMITANEIRNQIAEGELPASHWLRVYHQLQIIRETAELCQIRIADAGLVPADHAPEIPLVSLGQGDFRQDIYGTPQTGGEVSFG